MDQCEDTKTSLCGEHESQSKAQRAKMETPVEHPEDPPTQAAPPPSAESELNRIRMEFVERVPEEILKQLLDALFVDGVFNRLEKEAIIEINHKADKARSLIDDVGRKGEEASRKMMEHLQKLDPTLSSQLGLLSGPSAQKGKATYFCYKGLYFYIQLY
ncbi:caspase recruitment domain-containing protein 18-like isoform X2 [Odontesthes bonariensis]|uniref:caspase recruitment domain-containing protein 18-like isoform X2 n=1 Tax=Odontesthes bonariensis TaxID=219752 RepID=UPI003F58273C